MDESAQHHLEELAIQMQLASRAGEDGVDPEVERQQAIALARRKLDAAIHLYSEGMIDQAEFGRRREMLEHEIAHWQPWTTESEQMALELALCIEAVEKLAFIWEHSEDEDRQGFVRNLFEWIEYDLDARRITNFRLKPWADRFIVLRGALYEEEKQAESGDSEGEKELASPSQEVKQAVPHRRMQGRSFPQVLFAVAFAMAISYRGLELPRSPVSNGTVPKCVRNAEIRARHQKGESIATLAEVFGITEQRIWQILNDRRK